MIKLGIYKHYKSEDQYEVLSEAIYENTEEPVVVYKALQGERLTFVRPLAQFEESVEWNGQQVPRFTLISK
jgi:hypothetical protein